KSFGGKRVLHDLGLDIKAGAMVALNGASSAGESTLLRHLSGLACGDRQTASTVQVLSRSIQSNGCLDGRVRQQRTDLGYIFQQFNRVGRLSVLTNVLLGRLGRMRQWRGSLGMFNAHEKEQAMAALERVGLADFA